jgi:hypothetical protein
VSAPHIPENAMTSVKMLSTSWAVLSAVCAVVACTPTVKVATDEPITINLNVNIHHEILVKVDKQLDSAIDKNSDIF